MVEMEGRFNTAGTDEDKLKVIFNAKAICQKETFIDDLFYGYLTAYMHHKIRTQKRLISEAILRFSP